MDICVVFCWKKVHRILQKVQHLFEKVFTLYCKSVKIRKKNERRKKTMYKTIKRKKGIIIKTKSQTHTQKKKMKRKIEPRT